MDRTSLEAALDCLTEALEHLDRTRLTSGPDVRMRRALNATDIALGLVTDLLAAWDA